jgi:hypothetical protein
MSTSWFSRRLLHGGKSSFGRCKSRARRGSTSRWGIAYRSSSAATAASSSSGFHQTKSSYRWWWYYHVSSGGCCTSGVCRSRDMALNASRTRCGATFHNFCQFSLDFRKGRTMMRIRGPAVFNQILQRGWPIRTMKGIKGWPFTTKHDQRHVLFTGISLKRFFQHAHFPQQHSKGINVDRLVIVSILSHFGRHVSSRPRLTCHSI